ncbi:hypothetical protein [Roseicella aquatilis]|uniref:Uncharacterized protein n=1 Tax=Roseicella aquatilis TaxID=2527868 RepID=A0A4R4DIY2_9PROT|nr:hypothetical protein [Roseicella aquatilis]TCZ61291.1 hypothetical protein EXY23_12145 [Roseicella aquatilis]
MRGAGESPLRIAFGEADAGWIDLNIRWGDRSLRIMCSGVFCPFPRMIAFLEAVLDGEAPVLCIDEEGSIGEIRCLPAGSGISVVVTRHASSFDGATRIALERLKFATGRDAFVTAFYRAWRESMACHADSFAREWLYWGGGGPDEWDAEEMAAFETYRARLVSRRLDCHIGWQDCGDPKTGESSGREG